MKDTNQSRKWKDKRMGEVGQEDTDREYGSGFKYSDITDRQTAGERHNGGSKECSGPNTRGGLTQRPRETRESVFLVKKEAVLSSGGY